MLPLGRSDGCHFIPEGLHRLCHQCQAPHTVHASEPTHLPVPCLALCSLPILRVHHHGHDSVEHRGADDEGEPVMVSISCLGWWGEGGLVRRGPEGILVVSRRCFEAESEDVFPCHSHLKHHMPHTAGKIFPNDDPNNLDLLTIAERSGFTLCFCLRSSGSCLGSGVESGNRRWFSGTRARSMGHCRSSLRWSSAKRLAGPLLPSDVSLFPLVLLCSVHL